MSNEIAQLGFEIDTAALTGAQRAADATAASLDKMGKTAEAASAKMKKAGDEVSNAGKGAAGAGLSVRQLQDMLRQVQGQAANSGQAIEMLSQKFSLLAQGLGTGGAQGLTGALSGSVGWLARMATVLGPVGGVVAGVTGGITALAGAYVGLNAALAGTVDRYALLEGRLKNVYGSATAAREVFQSLTQLADKNALSVEQTAESYLRLARNNAAIGLTRQEMLKLTDAVQMLGRVSGASNGELAGAMMQFSQALAAGRLNGDELRSIMENMPALVKAIADGLGVSVGQVRAMGAAGELTGDKITKAILDQVPKIQKEFEGLPQTTEQAFTRVENAWAGLLVNMGQRLDSSGFMQSLYNATASLIELMSDASKPEALAEERVRLRREIASPGVAFMGMAGKQNTDPMKKRVAEIDRLMQTQLYEDMEIIAKERLQSMMAPATRAEGVIKELDKIGTRTKELETQRKTLADTLALYEKMPSQFIGKESQMEKLPGLIAQIDKQLKDTLPDLDKFMKSVTGRAEDLKKFGSIQFGADVRKLVDTMDASGKPISEGTAINAVIADRTQNLKEQSQSIREQIEVQTIRTAAVGKGREAEIAAEAQAKRLTLQYQLFGRVLTDEAVTALNEYQSALETQMRAEDAAAGAKALYNAQLDVSIQRQLDAAAATGMNAGALRELEKQLQRNKDIATADPEQAAAVAAQGQAADLAAARAERQRLQELSREIEAQRRLSGSSSPREARAISQDREARQYAEGFSPDRQEMAYQLKLSELRTKDAGTVRKTIEDRQRAVEMISQETELTKLGGIAATVAIARARELNAIRAEGLPLTEQEIDARLRLAEQEALNQDALTKAQENANRYKQMWENVGQSISSSLDSAFSKLLDGEKIKFKDFFTEIMKDIAQIIIRAQITQPIANMIGNTGGNTGGLGSLLGSLIGGGGGYYQSPMIYGAGAAFSGGHQLTMFANGGLVNRPTIFPMARGAGLMGEAGPEAVLPLKRGADGKLGVGAGASNDNGGVAVIVNDMRSGGERVETQDERGPDGKRMIRLTIRDEVKGQIRNGNYDAEMNTQYGARRVLARR